MKSPATTSIITCPHCGNAHVDRPVHQYPAGTPWTHYCVCPNTDTPINMVWSPTGVPVDPEIVEKVAEMQQRGGSVMVIVCGFWEGAVQTWWKTQKYPKEYLLKAVDHARGDIERKELSPPKLQTLAIADDDDDDDAPTLTAHDQEGNDLSDVD